MAANVLSLKKTKREMDFYKYKCGSQIENELNNINWPHLLGVIHVSSPFLFIPVFLGAEQEEDPEGDGARHADPPRRDHAGTGAAAAEDPAKAADGPDPPPAPDRAGEPDRVQQPAWAWTPPQACAGASAAAQKS